MSASPQQIRQTVERYLELVANGPATATTALFADSATVEDPVGSGVRSSKEEILDFYRQLDGLEQTTRLLALRIAGGEAAFHFEISTKAGDATITMSPMDVMTFDDDGRITSMRAFWSKHDMVSS
jgi:steroid delta-isomerase